MFICLMEQCLSILLVWKWRLAYKILCYMGKYAPILRSKLLTTFVSIDIITVVIISGWFNYIMFFTITCTWI